MQELERMIKFYHAAFVLFLILAIVFLIISVILFFRFHIREIFDMRTGRGARKAIQKMQELNDQTGKLRQEVINKTPIGLSPQERISPPVTEKRAETPLGMEGVQAGSPGNVRMRTSSYIDGSQKTEFLLDSGSQETTLLHDYNETTVLSSELIQDIPQPEKIKLPGAFRIEKEIMWVHTEEKL